MIANPAARAIAAAIEDGSEFPAPLTDSFTVLEIKHDGRPVTIDVVEAELTNTPESSSFIVRLTNGDRFKVTVEPVADDQQV